MEKKWFPQRNEFDAPIALLKNFIHYLNFPVSKFTIQRDVQNNPDFPLGVSLATYMTLLQKWTIQHKAFECPVDRLKDIASPSIIFIKSEKAEKTGDFVMFKAIRENIIEYLDTRRGWVLESMADFSDKFGGIALSAQSIETKEENFEYNESEFIAQKLTNPGLKEIRLVDDFLTDKECEYIINLATPEFQKSALMAEEDIVGYGRTSYTANFHIFPNDEVLMNIRKKASELIKLPEGHFEYFQCVSYNPNQEYQSHYDTFDENTKRGRKEIETRGQRKYTMLAYLNDDFEGGSTYFPNVDLLVQPKKRRVVIFNNLNQQGQIIPSAFHAGLPVTTGRKYAINIWVREKPFRELD